MTPLYISMSDAPTLTDTAPPDWPEVVRLADRN